MTAALALPRTRAPSLTLEDLEAVDEWRKRRRPLARHDDEAEPRPDRLREAGEIPGVDRWSPPEEVAW
jgi:hypothetical protein